MASDDFGSMGNIVNWMLLVVISRLSFKTKLSKFGSDDILIILALVCSNLPFKIPGDIAYTD